MLRRVWNRISAYYRENWKICGVLVLLALFIYVAQHYGLDREITVFVVIFLGYEYIQTVFRQT